MSEVDQFSALVGEIYDAALNPSLWPSVLQRLCGIVPAACGNIFTQDGVNKAANSAFTWGMDPVYFQSYLETYAHINPLFPGAFFQEVGKVFTTSDIMPETQMKRTRIYREWLRPQRGLDHIGAILEKSSTSYAMLALQLDEDQCPATDDMRKKMQLIVPHVQRAVLIGKVFDAQKAALTDFSATINALSTAVYLVNATGRIAHANQRGLVLLAAEQVVYGFNGGLRVYDQAADKALRKMLSDCASGDDLAIGTRGTALHLPSRCGDHYVAHLLPLMSGARRQAGLAHHATAAVFLHHAAANLSSPPEVLAKAFGLTPRELAVLFAVVEAGAVADVADLLGLSRTTVKTHLRHVFAKTNVSRQSELVKLVAGFMAPVG